MMAGHVGHTPQGGGLPISDFFCLSHPYVGGVGWVGEWDQFTSPSITISTWECIFSSFLALMLVLLAASEQFLDWCLVSPTVELYATQLDHQSHPKGPKRFESPVVVRQGSSITLNCTAREPEHIYPAWYYGTYLQPYRIYWFVNSSVLKVPNCDKKSRKIKTCLLSLVKIRPRDHGKYFCQAANKMGCTFKELDLKVVVGR